MKPFTQEQAGPLLLPELVAQQVSRTPWSLALIDGEQLTTLMIRHDVGVRVADTLHIKKVDEDFFSDE